VIRFSALPLLVLITCLLASPAAHAQRGADEPARAERDAEEERQVLRARLERRLDQVRDVERQIESAIARLDEGASPEEIALSFRPGMLDEGPRDRPDDRPPPTPPGFEPLDTPERITAFLEEHLPDLAEWMGRFHERNERMAGQFMERLGRQLSPIAALEETDPILFDIRLEEYRTGYRILANQREYRETARAEGVDSEAARTLRRSLVDDLNARFDLRLAALRHELATVEGRVESLREELARTEAEREETIAKQIDYVTDLDRKRWGGRRDRERGDDDRSDDRRRDKRDDG